MSTRHLLVALLSFACLPLIAQEATAPTPQAAAPRKPNIPDAFSNLTVLPANITKPQLMDVMKQFSITFKVRCSACHGVSDDLAEGSFASDDKPMKADTRKLMRLIQEAAAPIKPA